MASPSSRLPEEVEKCLKNARFLHLATCTGNVPHVSLMHFSYLPPNSFPEGSALPSGPTIIMTSDPRSKKTTNLTSNPNVSLLVHDWVSSRPPTNSTTGADRERSPVGGPRSSLAQMLMQMNSAAVSSISATINGGARVLEKGSEEERWCKERHLAENSFEEEGEGRVALSRPSSGNAPGDGGRGSYIEDEDVRVVVVEIRDGRISDWKGGVTDWAIEGAGQVASQHGPGIEAESNGGRPLVNGVVRC